MWIGLSDETIKCMNGLCAEIKEKQKRRRAKGWNGEQTVALP
jgi:hypothetical protein